MTAISPFGPEEPGIKVSARKYSRLEEALILEDRDFAAISGPEGAIECIPLNQPSGLKKNVLVQVEGRTQKLALYQGRRYKVIAHVVGVIRGKGVAQPKVSLRFALFDLINPPESGTQMVA